MGNRIIKETIRTSRSVNSMTDFQFRMWLYLITYVDDFGRGSADPALLKGLVFPLRRGITEQTISKTLAELATMGFIDLYEVDGQSYLCFSDWSSQQRRAKKSKFPAPDSNGYQMLADDITCKQMIADDINGYQMIADDITCSRDPSKLVQNLDLVPEGQGQGLEGQGLEGQGLEGQGLKELPPYSPPVGGGDGVGQQNSDVRFEQFWAAYPRKVGKQAAFKAWKRASPNAVLHEQILQAIALQAKSDQWRRDNGQYIPHPATWINQGRWDDEIPQNGAYSRPNYDGDEDFLGG